MDKQNPEHERFVRLFAADEPSIRAFVRRLVPTREDARDVLQEVAVLLWRKFDPARPDEEFRKWAFSVARFEILAWRRDKARDRHVLDADVLSLLADQAAEGEGSLSLQRDALKTCLEKMAEPQRKLLLNSYAARGGIQQVAEQNGRSKSGLYQWLYRIRMTLHDCIRRSLGEGSL